MESIHDAGTPASSSFFSNGEPPQPPKVSAPPAKVGRQPTLIGILGGPLSWYEEEDSEPPIEVAEARIRVKCDQCGRINTHGWTMDGVDRVDRCKVRHCHCPDRYDIRPARPGEPGFEKHEFLPTEAITRPARERRR